MSNGVVLALAAYAVYAWGDGIIKALGGQLSVFEIGFFNTLIAGTFILLIKPEGETWRGFWRMQRPWAVHSRARQIWRRWLSRRSQTARLTWPAMERLLERYPLVKPSVLARP